MNGSDSRLPLGSGSRVAVIGSGPAGSFFSYFFCQFGRRIGLDFQLDTYEWRDFSAAGPPGCNMCGGIISESLVQCLAADGINLPENVIERGIDSYVLRMDVGSVRIDTPLHEKRIGAVHRGAGPKGMSQARWQSFDGYLLGLAVEQGANLIRSRVEEITYTDGKLSVQSRAGHKPPYDLVVIATGINAPAERLLIKLNLSYGAPGVSRTYISEYYLGAEEIERGLGHSMQVFLLGTEGLEFAALIPKGEYVTMCLLGRRINDATIRQFLDHAVTRGCFPPDWAPPKNFCHCSPRINVVAARTPFADRIVFIGDAGVTRLYKDGIGAAYRAAKAAARTAVFHGVASEDFRKHYWPVCQTMVRDNFVGKAVFTAAHLLQKTRFSRRGILSMINREQKHPSDQQRMSMVLWDTFTGSAPYVNILFRTLHPVFIGRLIAAMISALFTSVRRT